MCLHVTVPEYIFSECSWAVFWMVAQHASRFSSNKREKWGASAMSTETPWMAKSSAWEKRRTQTHLVLIRVFPLGALCIIVCCPLSTLTFKQMIGEQKASNQMKSLWNLVQAWQQAEALISGGPFWEPVRRSRQRTGKCRCSFPPVTKHEPMRRRESSVHSHKDCSDLFFLPANLRKEDLRGKAQTKWVLFVCGWVADRYLPSVERAAVLLACVECLHWIKLLFKRDPQMP